MCGLTFNLAFTVRKSHIQYNMVCPYSATANGGFVHYIMLCCTCTMMSFHPSSSYLLLSASSPSGRDAQSDAWLLSPGHFSASFQCHFWTMICEHVISLGVTDCCIQNLLIVRGGAQLRIIGNSQKASWTNTHNICVACKCKDETRFLCSSWFMKFPVLKELQD